MHLKREAAAALAHAEALEAVVGVEYGEHHSQSQSQLPEVIKQQTDFYVQEQREWLTVDTVTSPPGQTFDNDESPSSAKHEVTQVTDTRHNDELKLKKHHGIMLPCLDKALLAKFLLLKRNLYHGHGL